MAAKCDASVFHSGLDVSQATYLNSGAMATGVLIGLSAGACTAVDSKHSL